MLRRSSLLAALILAAAASGRSQTVRVMPLGDSITEGTRNDLTYRHPLWHGLRAAGYCVDFVGTRRGVYRGTARFADFDQDHEGHWGWRADQVAAKVRGWAMATRPDVVLMHLGTNDMAGNWSVESTLADLAKIVDELRRVNPRIVIIVARLIPVSQRKSYSVDKLNAKIPAFALGRHTASSPVVLADHTKGFDPERDTYDGLHPNDAGYRKMAAVWLAALQSVLTKCPAADFTPYGTGCRGTAGVPRLAAKPGSSPLIGHTWTVALDRLPAHSSTVALGFLGLSDRTWGTLRLPLDLGSLRMPGCRLLAAPDTATGLVPSAGRAEWALPLPDAPVFLGLRLFQQAAVVDPGANPFGLSWSNAGRATLGAR